ncbi:MAG: helix-turn-helix transcriptional regulator [Anaerolineae bacterium]
MIGQQSSVKVGDILREWRKVRRLSQMDLALAANVSTRHLSFVETGRASPSDDLILRLSDALQLPLRHVNALLVAAGYAPRYTHWTLEDDKTGLIRAALEHLMARHAPYPALVVNRTYDLVMINEGIIRLLTWLSEDGHLLAGYTNLFEMMFAPDGLRHYLVQWDVLQHQMLRRLYEESIAYQSEALTRLYQDCLAQSDPPPASTPHEADPAFPVMTLAFQKGGRELHFFTAVTTFGTAMDVTIQELRIETFFPANAAAQQFFTD